MALGLKMLLDSLGIKIDPAAIEATWNDVQTNGPKFVAALKEQFESINARLTEVTAQNTLILASLNSGRYLPNPDYAGPAESRENNGRAEGMVAYGERTRAGSD